MRKTSLPLAALAVIAGLLIVIVALHEVTTAAPGPNNSTVPGIVTATATAAATPAADSRLNFSLSHSSVYTALGAFDAVTSSPEVTDWAGSRKNVSVVSLCTDACWNGTSPAWKIVLLGDGEYETFHTQDGAVAYAVNSGSAGDQANVTSVQVLNLSRVIDSDLAWSKANFTVADKAGTTQAVTMSLKAIGNKSYWDLYDSTGDQIQVVRLDAVTGEVVKRTSLGGE